MKRHSQYFVYILECKDKTYYTGYTNDLEKRVKEHNNNSRGAKYLRGKLPARLVWSKKYRYYKGAVNKEKLIKKLSHKEKEQLVKIYANGKQK